MQYLNVYIKAILKITYFLHVKVNALLYVAKKNLCVKSK